MSRRTSLGLDVLSKIRAYVVKEGLVSERKDPHPLQIRKVKQAKGHQGRPASCFDFHIEHLESLGFHDEKITLRDSRAKKRLQDRQDKLRQRLADAEHGMALRDDLARTIREIRRRCPIVDGKRQTTNYWADYERPIHEAVKALVYREPDLFVRSEHHAPLVRKVYRQREQIERDGGPR